MLVPFLLFAAVPVVFLRPTDPEPAVTLTWGWALYVVVPFLLFVAVLVILIRVIKKFWR